MTFVNRCGKTHAVPNSIRGGSWLCVCATSLALLITSPGANGAARKALATCAEEITGPAKEIAALAEYGIERNLLSQNQIEESLLRPKKPANPLLNFTSTQENVSLKQGFQEVLPKVQRKDLPSIRNALTNLLNRITGKREQTQQARQNTRTFIAPHELSAQNLDFGTVEEIRYFWQKDSAGRLRAVGVTRGTINDWYPNHPELAHRSKLHKINFQDAVPGYTHAPQNEYLISMTPTRDGDFLIAYRALPAVDKSIRSEIRLYSYNTFGSTSYDPKSEAGSIASVRLSSEPLKIKLYEAAYGHLYLVAVTPKTIEVYRREGAQFTPVRSVPGEFNGLDTSLFTGILPGNDVLVLAVSEEPSTGSPRLQAFNPIRSEQPVVTWALQSPVFELTPFYTKGSELMVAGIAAGELSRTFLRQQNASVVVLKRPGMSPLSTAWHESQDGRFFTIHAEETENQQEASIVINEPFAPGAADRAPYFVQKGVAHIEHYRPWQAWLLQPLPRFLTLAGGKEVFTYHTSGGVRVHSLSDLSEYASGEMNPLPNYLSYLDRQSGDIFAIGNVHNKDYIRQVHIQNLTTQQPVATLGDLGPTFVLPMTEDESGRPVFAYTTYGDASDDRSIHFISMTSTVSEGGANGSP